VLVKEVGAGFSPAALEKLRDAGVRCLDASGRGGTSWTKVEGQRGNAELGRVLGDWGVPTAFSVVAARRILGEDATVVASGGIRDGLDAAKSIALGADLAGLARPVVLALRESGEDAVRDYLRGVVDQLRAVMLLVGATDLRSLKTCPKVVTGELREWLESHGWLGG
jgi:isopentenyl-diphosphate delta-isomerase